MLKFNSFLIKGRGFFSASNPLSRGLFSRTSPMLTLQSVMQRNVSTKEYIYDGIGEVRAKHFILSVEPGDTSKTVVGALSTLVATPNSLIILTERSRLLQQKEGRKQAGYKWNVVNPEEVTIEDIHRETVTNLKFRPDPGHLSIGVTDESGSIVSELSYRPGPGKSILLGTPLLHPSIYGESLSSTSVSLPSFPTITDEVVRLAGTMLSDNSVLADVTVIELSKNLKVTRQELLESIASVKMNKIYNLCTSAIKTEDIQAIPAEDLKKAIEQLIEKAKSIPELRSINLKGGQKMLAAMACTHAVVETFYKDSHALERRLGPDLAVQVVTIYCVAELMGPKFIEFAKNDVKLLDQPGELSLSATSPGGNSTTGDDKVDNNLTYKPNKR